MLKTAFVSIPIALNIFFSRFFLPYTNECKAQLYINYRFSPNVKGKLKECNETA